MKKIGQLKILRADYSSRAYPCQEPFLGGYSSGVQGTESQVCFHQKIRGGDEGASVLVLSQNWKRRAECRRKISTKNLNRHFLRLLETFARCRYFL
jgi:hypothetical protein